MTDALRYRGLTIDEMPSGWLAAAIDGLHAYDSGATDSGVHDGELRAFVDAVVKSLDPDARRRRLSEVMYELSLAPEAIEQGYGWEDARELGDWFENQFGVG